MSLCGRGGRQRRPKSGQRAESGWGLTHLQDVGEAVLELVPVQLAAVHAHLPGQGPRALQPPGDGIQQRGFPRAWGRQDKALEKPQ